MPGDNGGRRGRGALATVLDTNEGPPHRPRKTARPKVRERDPQGQKIYPVRVDLFGAEFGGSSLSDSGFADSDSGFDRRKSEKYPLQSLAG